MAAAYIFLQGLPGAGKGTLTNLLSKKLPIVSVSCGDIFRRHVNESTPLGLLALQYIKKGELTPDEQTSEMFISHLEVQPDKGIYILEGFPRTLAQARALEFHMQQSGRSLEKIIYLKASQDELVRRIAERRICSNCGAIYNVLTRSPRHENRCDFDGDILVQRADDHEDVARSRIEFYAAAERPMLDYYTARGTIEYVDADAEIEIVTNSVLAIIAATMKASN